MRSFLVALTAAVGLVTPLLALDPTRHPWHYGYAQWQDRDGLPQNTVQAIAQTTDGYLWLGTEAGLVRFNGRAFQTFDTSSEPALRSNSVTALAAAPDGGLWIGTRGGLLLLHGGRFQRYDRLPNDTVRALALGADGTLWAGTNGGVALLRGGRLVRTWTTRDGLPSNAIRALAVEGDDAWIGTGAGLRRIRHGALERPPVALPSDTVRAICLDRSRRAWIGTEASGLYTADGRHYTKREGLTSDSIRALLEDSDGNLWIGTVDGGINRLRDGRIEKMTRGEGLNSDHVRALHEDREGSLWVGTEAGGLAQLRAGRAVNYSTIDGLRSDFIRAVRGDPSGTLWAGTEGGGLHRFTGDRFELDSRIGVPNAFVTALHWSTDGTLWAGTEGKGAICLGRNGRRVYSTADGLSDNSVWAIAEGSDGVIWLGSSNGLLRVQGESSTTFRIRDGLRGNSVRALHAGRDGSLWIATRSFGLQRWRNGRFETMDLPEPVRNAAFTSFLEEPDGQLWISSSAGVLHWDGRRLRPFTARDGLFSDNLFQLLDDAQGRLWCSSSRGIFAVSKRELLGGARVRPIVFTRADGMRSSECSGDAQPAGWRAPDGTLWFATIRGVVRIRPQESLRPLPPPSVVIEQVAINGRVTRERVSPPGNRLFSVRFAALTYLAPEKTRFRYRLDGVDADWIETAGLTEAVYHGVPPGAFTFRVTAAHENGAWAAQAASVDFAVKPFFHQTAWFYAGCLGAILVLGYAVHRTRTVAMQREFAAVLGERTRIAREIHDTLLQGFAGSALQLNAIAKRWQRDPASARQQLDGVLDQIDGCLAEARREIGELREGAEPALPFAESLRAAAAGATQVEVQGEPRAIPAEVEKSLLRITREAVANAVRHAQASAIRVRLEFHPAEIRLTACDNGRGLAAPDAPLPGHFGLVGMRERAELHGGRFVLRSQPAQGTEIEVTLPV